MEILQYGLNRLNDQRCKQIKMPLFAERTGSFLEAHFEQFAAKQ
jgi:hypothetical protein